jgi:type II secretory pathway pseudopilin PulG
MSVVAIVVLAVLAVLLLLAVVGAASASRRNRAGAERFAASLATVDRQLAAAVATDRGWARETLEAAARSEFASRRPGVEIATLELIQMTDEPGTDQDLAVFRVATGADAGASILTLGRRDGAWYAASVEDER